MSSTPAPSVSKAHLDIHDQFTRQALAQSLGVTEENIKRAVRMVGTRISTIRGYFGH